VEETHGPTKYNVSFSRTDGTSTRCEIADLLIISRSAHYPFLRATFWQAKKQNKSKWVSFSSPDKHIDFKGQFNQWDLLSRRPAVSGIAPFLPPTDLLSCFDSASIGSFGIFYEKASKIEVMHSTAEFVACGSPKPKHSTMVANAYLERYLYYGHEVIVRATLEPFLEALFGHQIGALLTPAKTAHRWLTSYAAAKLAASDQNVSSDFFLGFDAPSAIDSSDRGDGVSVLFVDGRDAA
jgi:hypothetical protein